jgi:hypothetical protein
LIKEPKEMSLWCFPKNTGENVVCIPTVPCKKEANKVIPDRLPVPRNDVEGREALVGFFPDRLRAGVFLLFEAGNELIPSMSVNLKNPEG